jgi:hypothetical protein
MVADADLPMFRRFMSRIQGSNRCDDNRTPGGKHLTKAPGSARLAPPDLRTKTPIIRQPDKCRTKTPIICPLDRTETPIIRQLGPAETLISRSVV